MEIQIMAIHVPHRLRWKIVHHQAGATMGLAPPSKDEAI